MAGPSAPPMDRLEAALLAFDCAEDRPAFVPRCEMCNDALIMWGGPILLACGHNLCLNCLQKSQQPSFLCPLCHEIDEWVPVSAPPMELNDYEMRLYENGGGRGALARLKVSPDKKLGALFAAMRKILVEYRKERMASRKQTIYSPQFDADVESMRSVFEAEPPEWLPDSSAASCMRCQAAFRPLRCGRHHCRFCGAIYCGKCSTSRSLLPYKFRVRDPQRVCDDCASALEPGQTLLAFQVSRAAQAATYDVTDYSCLGSWLNSPLGLSMEHEIYKATNAVRQFHEAARASPEKSIPWSVLKGARGLAILTVLKAGMMVTYKVGTGVVLARSEQDDSWSPPSAIASCGVGWGPQIGGELTDFIIVLRTEAAVKAFSGRVHLSVGAGVSLAAGPVGRLVEADVRTGDGGTAACYTYSCTKGAFVGCSLEGNVVVTRSSINSAFYGDACVSTDHILFGTVPQPRAAMPLYKALHDLVQES